MNADSLLLKISIRSTDKGEEGIGRADPYGEIGYVLQQMKMAKKDSERIYLA